MFALCGLASQLLIASYYVIVYTVGLTQPHIVASVQVLVPYIYDVLTLSGPVCLYMTR